MKQLSFADLAIQQNRKASRVMAKLDKIDALVDWSEVLKLVKVVDKTQSGLGGAPHKDLLTKVKMLFLQELYDLSDPELEDQVNDRLSFQHFAGIDFDTTVPDFTTIWRFKEALIKERVMDGLFDTVLSSIEAQGCLVKKGTIVDATLVDSSCRTILASSTACSAVTKTRFSVTALTVNNRRNAWRGNWGFIMAYWTKVRKVINCQPARKSATASTQGFAAKSSIRLRS